MPEVNLPTWEEASKFNQTKQATALSDFIFCNEPAQKDEVKQFREMLAEVVEQASVNPLHAEAYALIVECNEYLLPNKLNSICSTSILHQKMQDLIKRANEVTAE